VAKALEHPQAGGFLALVEHVLTNGFACVDLREQHDFEQNHVKNFSHIMAEHLPDRVAELPIKAIPLILFGTELQINSVLPFLGQRKYQVLQCWIVDNMIPSHWLEMEQLQCVEKGPEKQTLWQANRYLQSQIALIESERQPPMRALDLGCGSGREAVFLAKRGWTVDVVDNQQMALDRSLLMANFHKVQLQTHHINLKTQSPSFVPNGFDLICMFRFLERDLLSQIKLWLKPGGRFICETFSTEAIRFGKPKNKALLLKSGELQSAFQEWDPAPENLRYLSDGRPLIGFCVKKPL